MTSNELARLIESGTGYRLAHADTLRGDPGDFHAEAVSLKPGAAIRVRATAGTRNLDEIAALLVEAGHWVGRGKWPEDADYGDDVLLVFPLAR